MIHPMIKYYFFINAEEHQPEMAVKLAVAAEDVGFDGVMISDHLNPWVDDAAASGFTFTTLGAIAQATQRVKLMTAVTVPLWRLHPVICAQAAATVDRISGGRFTLGVGMGRAHDEEVLGYDYPPYAERNMRMRESLEVMRRLLDGEKLSFEGEYYQTENAKLYSPPISEVPIVLAAGGPKSAALAADSAAGVMMSVKDIASTKERVLEPYGGAGVRVAMRWSVVAANEDEAFAALQAQRGARVPERDDITDPEELRKRADNMPREEILSRYTLVKEPGDLVPVYREVADELNADIVGLQIAARDLLSVVPKLGTDVLSQLRKAA